MFTAFLPPACFPSCGKNAHCQYGSTNECVCNSGTTGNPYEECTTVDKKTCTASSCGKGAVCRESYGSIECICPSGFDGNPYISCTDIDECNTNNVCGENAVCINTPGSYDCRCKKGYVGNPFVVCSEEPKGICHDAKTCACNDNVICPVGYTCDKGKCIDLCQSIKCGPRATCDEGQCICPQNYLGDPYDLHNGCTTEKQCSNDIDCRDSEICFQLVKGVRKCVDACSKVQCGPNALCVGESHRSVCICAPGYNGNPTDLTIGCQLEERYNPKKECEDDSDCSSGTICAVDIQGTQKCINPCETVACGLHEVCQLDSADHPTCTCKPEFVWNPVTSLCEKPSIPDCNTDGDCATTNACLPDALGILKCTTICEQFTCPKNAACVAENHRGQCQCLTGFTGNPNDRNGCVPMFLDQCSSDAQCTEQDTCKKFGEHQVLMCRPACESVTCGPNAICVVNNHVPRCQCPPGPYAGDPTNPITGCQTVPCVYNIDCPPSQLCNRMTHTCYDVCNEESCGTNAICIADGHRAICQCPPGFQADPIPEVECTAVDACNPNPCHTSAICEGTPTGYTCKCPPANVGDPFTTGCRPEGSCPRGNSDCPPQSVCQNGKCVSPCGPATCGPNGICTVVDRKPVCTCPSKFAISPEGPHAGCIRISTACSNDFDCDNEICYFGQCKVACRNNYDCSQNEKCIQQLCVVPCAGASQCRENEACINGTCVLGCRSNKNCPANEACINGKCQNPCEQTEVCGPNAVCSCDNHSVTCKCPPGFEGNPEQGCIRSQSPCETTRDCPVSHMCIANKCSMPCVDDKGCAFGERCDNNVCVKICYSGSNCLQGEVCLKGICQEGCVTDSDCRQSEICIRNQCKCSNGYIRTPQGCIDINECEDSPCHRSASCVNEYGSYRCICPEGTVGDPFIEPGCVLPGQCSKDTDCDSSAACRNGKCRDVCSDVSCAPGAICNMFEHRAVCICPSGHLGDPFDKDLGCFKVECLVDADCTDDRYCHEETNKCISKSKYCSNFT